MTRASRFAGCLICRLLVQSSLNFVINKPQWMKIEFLVEGCWHDLEVPPVATPHNAQASCPEFGQEYLSQICWFAFVPTSALAMASLPSHLGTGGGIGPTTGQAVLYWSTPPSLATPMVVVVVETRDPRELLSSSIRAGAAAGGCVS